MAEIVLEIEKCNECPFVKTQPTETHDWFEDYVEDYFCGKNGRELAVWVERIWEIPDVPDWCPIRKEHEYDTLLCYW